jgi:hypothetical protein
VLATEVLVLEVYHATFDLEHLTDLVQGIHTLRITKPFFNLQQNLPADSRLNQSRQVRRQPQLEMLRLIKLHCALSLRGLPCEICLVLKESGHVNGM